MSKFRKMLGYCGRDMYNKRFGRLVAISLIGSGKYGLIWRCRCDCGKIKDIIGNRMTVGKVRSCGCLATEANTTHGHSKTSIYRAWSAMLDRCYNVNYPSYHRYGGRGIGVCKRWKKSFENFLADMGEKPNPHLELDRINNNRGYYKSNCRWATKKMQARNRLRNRWITFNKRKRVLSDWAEILNINRFTLHDRLKRGWSTKRALTTPTNKQHQKNRKNLSTPKC